MKTKPASPKLKAAMKRLSKGRRITTAELKKQTENARR